MTHRESQFYKWSMGILALLVVMGIAASITFAIKTTGEMIKFREQMESSNTIIQLQMKYLTDKFDEFLLDRYTNNMAISDKAILDSRLNNMQKEINDNTRKIGVLFRKQGTIDRSITKYLGDKVLDINQLDNLTNYGE